MPRRSAALASLLALAASACTWGDPDGLSLRAVTPTEGPNLLDVPIVVAGSGFDPAVVADFDHPGRSTVDDGFAVALVSASGRVPLGQVSRASSTELRATLAAGAPPGTYDVEVRDPQGRVATLAAAFVVYVPMPPTAILFASPGGGTAGTSPFTLDASASADARHPLSTLQFRFDPRGDGSWTDWSATPTTLPTTYASAGVYTAAVQVRDALGLVGWATTLVVVAAPGAEVAVTTAVDENDPGATPTAWGGTGLSLREAIAWVNAQGTAKTITLAAPMTIAMIPPQAYMTLSAPGAAIVAEHGVTLDFGGINQPCLTLAGPNERLVGVTLKGCTGTFVQMNGASGGSQVAQITTSVTGTRYWAYGIQAQSSSATWSRIGPGNDLSGLFFGLKIEGSNYEILGNRVHDNAIGARLSGAPARLWQNTFAGQVIGGPNKGLGVDILNGSGPVEILQNTFFGNGADGVAAAAVASLTVRNNLFTANGGIGLNAQVSGLVADHDGYFGNAGGAVAAGLSTGPTDLLADPLYADAAGGDFRLLPASPAIDAGVDTGLDVNGPAPGLFSGLAPDLGAFESR